MSDGAISQDEIDALLSGVDMGGLGGGNQSAASSNINTAVLQTFAEGLKDKLVDNLNKQTGVEFSMGNPVVEAVDRDQLLSRLPESVVAITADFNATLKGDHLFIIAPEFAQKLVSLINKEDNAELDEMAFSIIAEVMQQHSGAEITDLCSGGKLPGLTTIPPNPEKQPKPMVRMPQGSFALFTYPLTVDGTSYNLWEAISSEVATGITDSITGNSATASNRVDTSAMGENPMAGGMQNPMGNPMMNMGMSMNQMQMPSNQAPLPGIGYPNVQSLQFPNLQGGATTSEQGNIGLIMDVYMEMTVELGRTKKQIKEILGMGEGTIIELDKLAGEPVDILVNHKPIAKGEVVVIDENFGVRVTEILSPSERVSNLH